MNIRKDLSVNNIWIAYWRLTNPHGLYIGAENYVPIGTMVAQLNDKDVENLNVIRSNYQEINRICRRAVLLILAVLSVFIGGWVEGVAGNEYLFLGLAALFALPFCWYNDRNQRYFNKINAAIAYYRKKNTATINPLHIPGDRNHELSDLYLQIMAPVMPPKMPNLTQGKI